MRADRAKDRLVFGLACLASAAAIGLLPSRLRAQAGPAAGAGRGFAETAAFSPDGGTGLRLGAGMAFGVLNLPKVGAGATVLAHVRPRRFVPIELAAVYWFENEDELNFGERDLHVHPLLVVPFPPGGSRSAFRAIELKATLCPFVHPLVRGSLLGCAGVSGGALFARSEGLLAPSDPTRPLFGFEAYLRWQFPLVSRIELTYSVGLFAALIRERFGYVDSLGIFREQFQIAPLGGRLDAALGYRF